MSSNQGNTYYAKDILKTKKFPFEISRSQNIKIVKDAKLWYTLGIPMTDFCSFRATRNELGMTSGTQNS